MGLINLSEHQKHIVFNDGDSVNVIPLSLIRAFASGEVEPDKSQAQLLARVLLDNL